MVVAGRACWRARLSGSSVTPCRLGYVSTHVRFLSAWLLVPGMLLAQVPRVGLIEFYGVHHVSEERLRRVLGLHDGDPLPPSKADVEERLEKIPGVVLARLEAVCCTDGRAILYVGVEERGAPHCAFRPPPQGDFTLAPAVVDTYGSLLEAFKEATRAGRTGQSTVAGHALSLDPAVRAYQQDFLDLASTNLQDLRQVLRDSADASQRAIAAYVLGYAPDKRQVVADLQYAMQDPDQSVRTNAMRSLEAIAELAERDPKLGIRVEPTWFVELLNSIVWSDRERAAEALVEFTENRNSAALSQIRERALPSVIEMARWKTLAHALPAFILAGRIAGLSEKRTQDAWSRGERESVIRRALAAARAQNEKGRSP
jgi:hypothetical protein